jgi:hypothetical protein
MITTAVATFVRFAVTARHAVSDQQQGVFTALYTLKGAGALLPYEEEWFQEIERWFNANLASPSRMAWSSRPNAPKRAISWLKLSATEHVTRMRELVTLLEHKDVAVEEFRTDKPGYIVYEDDHQIAAIPFTTETF